MKAKGHLAKTPIRESFGNWQNAKTVLIVLAGLMAGQAVITNAGPVYSALFLMNTLKVDPFVANMLSVVGLLIGAPFYVIFGRLSDRVGRKPLIVTALALSALTLFPVYRAITHYANPALETAQEGSPVVVVADPDDCSIQFNPVGTSKFTSSCDVAKTALVRRGVPYSNETVSPGTQAAIKIGSALISSYDALAADAKIVGQRFDQELTIALDGAGYRAKADLSQVNHVMIIVLIVYLQFLAAMVFGPMAAALVEVFPSRIRYTSLSLPYHIGNGWIGGLLPASIVAIQAASGSIYDGLWYPVIISAVGFVVCLLLVPETKDRKMDV
jgi:MFS family permease